MAAELNKSSGMGGRWQAGGLLSDSFETIRALNSTGTWVAVLKNSLNEFHAVIVDGIDSTGRIIIRDPANGGSSYAMNFGDFQNHLTRVVFHQGPRS